VERDRRPDVQEPVRRLNWTTIALIAGLVLVVILVAYFATSRSAEQDKLTNAEVAASTPAPSQEKLCASNATYDLVKRELFRRAAQLRGNDQAIYDQLSAAAALRMENPVMESQDSSTGAANCSGSLSIDLPPGVAAVGDRRTLTADVDYTVQPAADGSGNVVLLHNADAIIAPLATLARTEQPAPMVETPTENGVSPEAPETNQAAPQPLAPSTAPPQQPGSRTGFSSDAGLAALDRDLSGEYGQAFAVASPEQRMLLRQTARRFDAYRSRCSDRQCITAAYAGRIREIHDIIEDRWQPPQ
jgi:hypothetical protein